MHVHVIQPALPWYRVDFFDRIAQRIGPGFTVYHPVDQAALGLEDLAVAPASYPWQCGSGTYRTLPLGLAWHDGVVSIPLAAGDVLVIPGGPRCLSYMALLARARLKGAKVIWWGHYWSSTSRRWRFALRLALMRLSSAVLLYTDSEIERLRAGGWREDLRPVSALNNGVDTVPIRTSRTPYRAADRARTLLFIGRLTEKARLADLLAAMARPGLEDVGLEVIGSGEEREALGRLASALEIADRVTWHGTMTDESMIAAIANRCAVFVYPGSVGLSLIHAMAYGLPSVVHDDRWHQMPEIDAFSDGVTGRAFGAGDIDSLSRVITETLRNPAALDRWSEACIARTTDSYNTQAMAARFCEFVERVRHPDGRLDDGRIDDRGDGPTSRAEAAAGADP